MRQRVRQRDIAERAGVDVSTVSLALNAHPRIPAATRARIRAIADELGYRPDPALAGLAANRFQGRSNRHGLQLGYLRERHEEESDEERLYRIGMERRCRALGYHMRRLDWEQGDDAEGLLKELRLRGLRGLLVAQSGRPLPPGLADNAQVPLVRCGMLTNDEVDTVCPDLTAAVDCCARRMLQRHRQLAFLLNINADWDSDRQILAASLAWQHRLGRRRLRVIEVNRERVPKALAELERCAPEGIVCIDHWSREALARRPQFRGIPVATLHTMPPFAGKLGVDLRLETIGQAAVNLLEIKLRLPPLVDQGARQVLSIAPRWVG